MIKYRKSVEKVDGRFFILFWWPKELDLSVGSADFGDPLGSARRGWTHPVARRADPPCLAKRENEHVCIVYIYIYSFFPECVARVPVSLWGSGGLKVCFARRCVRVRNRPQPFVRTPYGRAYGKFCRGGHFWRFQTCRCFVSRGRRGTSWHSDVFWNVSKVVLRGRRNTFVTFSEDVLQFSWQAQHFGRVHRHFSWQAQHFRRVVLRVFCKSHWQGCVKWRQGANSVAGVAFCAMCWKLTEASHETSILMLPIFGF